MTSIQKLFEMCSVNASLIREHIVIDTDNNINYFFWATSIKFSAFDHCSELSRMSKDENSSQAYCAHNSKSSNVLPQDACNHHWEAHVNHSSSSDSDWRSFEHVFAKGKCYSIIVFYWLGDESFNSNFYLQINVNKMNKLK